MAYFKKIAERNEWWEIGGLLKNVTTRKATNITGRNVTMTVRSGPASSDPVITVNGALAWVVDGTNGIAACGGRIAEPATYYGTLQVGTSADGPSWPVIAQFQLEIQDCP